MLHSYPTHSHLDDGSLRQTQDSGISDRRDKLMNEESHGFFSLPVSHAPSPNQPPLQFTKYSEGLDIT